MTDEDLKEVIALYQQKSFELFNKNIVLEAQVNKLTSENQKLKSSKTRNKTQDDF